MDFDKELEFKDFAFAFNFKGSQPDSYQVNIFPTHGVGHYAKPYFEFLHAEAFE